MLGNKLRQAREAKGAPLQEVEWATKIKAPYLEALEEENYRAIPGSVYVRGFLRTYARYLDLDPEPLIAEYNAADEDANKIISTRPAVRVDPRPLVVTPTMIVGLALVLLLAIFGLYVKAQFDRYQASSAASSQPAPHANILSPAPSASPVPSPSSTVKVYTGVELVVQIQTGATWLRVDTDGQPSLETGAGGKIYQPGTLLTFTGSKSVHLISGKATNTLVTVNGQDQGPMQGTGDVADKTYTKT